MIPRGLDHMASVSLARHRRVEKMDRDQFPGRTTRSSMEQPTIQEITRRMHADRSTPYTPPASEEEIRRAVVGDRISPPSDAPFSADSLAEAMRRVADRVTPSRIISSGEQRRAQDRDAAATMGGIADNVAAPPTTAEVLETMIAEREVRAAETASRDTQLRERGVAGISPQERELLTLLIEECAELQQMATKTLRHGWSSYNPTGSHELINQDLMQHEYIDLTTVINQLMLHGRLVPVDPIHMNSCWQRKLRYLHHQGS